MLQPCHGESKYQSFYGLSTVSQSVSQYRCSAPVGLHDKTCVVIVRGAASKKSSTVPMLAT